MGYQEAASSHTIKDLRHTAATLWLASGIDPKTVQTWLGHATMTLTVDRYGRWIGADADRAALRRFEAYKRGHAVSRTPNLRASHSRQKHREPRLYGPARL